MKQPNSTIYKKLGLYKEDVLSIQEFLFPMMNEKFSVADMIVSVSMNYKPGNTFYTYAIFLIGWHIGAARIEESFGITHVLNPNAV